MNVPGIFDLSHTLTPSISVFPGSGSPVVHPVSDFERDGFRENRLTLTTHHGTHVDCPFHILENGFSTENASLSHFFGNGRVIDCRKISSADSITLDFISTFEPLLHGLEFLLLCTGMDQYWNTSRYTGPFPVLTPEAALYLTGFQLKGIGLDALSIDPVEGPGWVVNHKILLSRNIIIIENLTGLEKLLAKPFRFFCFPLKIQAGDGSPVRACAVPEE